MGDFDKKEIIPVSYLKEGMVLNGNIYDMNGGFLWPAKVPIKREFIESLNKLGLTELTYRPMVVDTSFSKQNVEEPMISEVTQKKVYDSFSSVVWDITNSQMPRTEKAKESVEEVAKEIKVGLGKNLNLLDLKGHDSYTYVHAVNTSLLSTYIASRFALSFDKVCAVGVGALLIDIGKIKIPTSILNKKEPLSQIELETIKKHPVIGYQLIKDNQDLDEVSKKIVLLHHEQMDGKGYPLGVEGSKLDIYTKIVSLCDSFDAMTTERPYRPPLPVRVAVEEILKSAGTKYDPEVALKFAVEVSRMYKIQSPISEGTVVELTSGEFGIVKKAHSDYDLSPEVIIALGPNLTPVRVISVDLTKDAVDRKIRRVVFNVGIILKVKALVGQKL
ncbi:MAG: HD-GYP domain-containing protein [Brevinematia bacterium]